MSQFDNAWHESPKFQEPAFAGLGVIDSKGTVVDQSGLTQLAYVATHLHVNVDNISHPLAEELTGRPSPISPSSRHTTIDEATRARSDLFWMEAEIKFRVKMAKALLEECAK